uniref:PUB domain-containing protein n=2 Tax=Corethron hystrix TaxID=216773 RepID=A0A7S1BPJ5_9STRA|mmetsp:Transcript_36385/g.85075  ORF Transcript_36385/g.85075 Transcript_36385/m.85075 type:complete len:288 (+) Transcript_36385:221-1084(+)
MSDNVATMADPLSSALDSMFASSAFDADILTAITTLIKYIDGILKDPHGANSRVRQINTKNAAFRRRVASVPGGLEFLFGIGFKMEGESTEMILERNREHHGSIREARAILVRVACEKLKAELSDFPVAPRPSVTSTVTAPTKQMDFDPYRSNLYNTSAAVLGADPTGIDPTGEDRSKDFPQHTTETDAERKVQEMKKKVEEAELREQNSFSSTIIPSSSSSNPVAVFDRMLCVLRPGENLVTPPVTAKMTDGAGGDAGIIASRARRMQEERKKMEDAGFTTKAMRE